MLTVRALVLRFRDCGVTVERTRVQTCIGKQRSVTRRKMLIDSWKKNSGAFFQTHTIRSYVLAAYSLHLHVEGFSSAIEDGGSEA